MLVFAVLAVVGCEPFPVQLDPLSVNGRDGGGPVPTYDALMRIGTAARAGGDLANALGVFRRAAQLAPLDPAPLLAAGDVLLEIGDVNEAIVTYNAALVLPGPDLPARVGLAKAYLKTGKPELALAPINQALAETPDDPKLLLLLGVTNDLSGHHWEAQNIYRRGLSLAPGDPALTVNLALSLALSGSYPTAIAVLQPIAMSPTGTAQERQTLALIYGLTGNSAEAARLGGIDLDQTSVEHNLAYYQTLRALPPDARNQAILSAGLGTAKPS
jgi:Flp pilus assembly protein TadD